MQRSSDFFCCVMVHKGPQWSWNQRTETVISISRTLHLCMPDGLKNKSNHSLNITYGQYVECMQQTLSEWDVAAVAVAVVKPSQTVTMMSWRQENASRCNDPFLSLKWLLTFSLLAVFLKSVINSENMIKLKQYIAVLIIFSTVCPRYDQHGQATLVQRTYDAVTDTELYTVIPVRQLGSWNKLLRSPGPTEALIIEASFCVFVHRDLRILGFEYVCILCFAFFALQNKVQQVCKERKTKKVCEKLTVCMIYLFLTGIPQLAKCF